MVKCRICGEDLYYNHVCDNEKVENIIKRIIRNSGSSKNEKKIAKKEIEFIIAERARLVLRKKEVDVNPSKFTPVFLLCKICDNCPLLNEDEYGCACNIDKEKELDVVYDKNTNWHVSNNDCKLDFIRCKELDGNGKHIEIRNDKTMFCTKMTPENWAI